MRIEYSVIIVQLSLKHLFQFMLTSLFIVDNTSLRNSVYEYVYVYLGDGKKHLKPVPHTRNCEYIVITTSACET